MLPSFCQQTITVRRPALRESRGSLVKDWINATTHTVSGCSIQLQSTSSDMDGRTIQVTNSAILYAPYGADIQAGDRIGNYEITGEPMPVYGATGNLSHLEIPLSNWRG